MRDIISIAKSGLHASERGISVAANNLANANTPGFSRQRVELSPDGYRVNNQSVGLGVNIEQVTRLRNEMIDSQIRMKESMIEGFAERSAMLEQIQDIFSSSSGNDLDQILGKFLNSFSELTNNPEDMVRRENVLREGQHLTQKFNSMAGELELLQETTGQKGMDTIGQINSLLKDVSDLNLDIRRSHAAGKQDHNSLDLQTQKLAELSKLVDIDTRSDENGSLEVRIGGIIVVQNDTAVPLRGEADPVNDIFRVRLGSGAVVEPQGGKLGAHISMYQSEIADYIDQLDEIANELMNQLNGLHTSGFDLNGNPGISFFNPDSSGASDIAINTLLLNNPAGIAASDAPNAPGNMQIAASIAALRTTPLEGGQSLMERTINLSTQAGRELNATKIQLETARSSRDMLFNQQESISGVNVDEELTELIKFQNSYQASARVLNSAQQMYDTLLSIV